MKWLESQRVPRVPRGKTCPECKAEMRPTKHLGYPWWYCPACGHTETARPSELEPYQKGGEEE